jgi:hypothetical protein
MAQAAAEQAAKDELLRLQHARMMEIREAERVAAQMAQAAAERMRKRRSLFWSCLPLAVVVGCGFYATRGVPTRLQEPAAAPVPTAQQKAQDDLDNRWSLPMADYVALMEVNRSVLQQMRREADTVTAGEYLVQASQADAANLARETEKAAKTAQDEQDVQKQAQRMADHAAQVERQQVAEDAAAVAQWEQRKQVDAAALEAIAVAAAAEAKAAQRGLSEKVRLSGGADPAGAIAEVDAAATRAWYARKAADAAKN